MRRNLILVILICNSFFQFVHSQETWQIILENDTLTEVGREVFEKDDYLYVVNRTRCQPNAQSCGVFLKYDKYGDLKWRVEMPDIKMGNDNIIHSYKGDLIVTGRSNDGSLPLKFGFYELDTAGTILDLTEIDLPYQSNFNYGSLVKGDTLYMYGTGREDISEPGINVDALIVTYDLVQDTFSYEYFDYGHDFVDIWDMRMIEDGSILFYSSHKRTTYTNDSLDWVVERLWPDGQRTTTYNQPYNNDGGVSFPQMEYLGDGLIALMFPNEDKYNVFFPNIRIINLEGEVVAEQNYEFTKQNTFRYTADIRRTNNGDILLCGGYNDKQIDENDLTLSSNAYVSKMTRDGTIEWLRHFRAENDESGDPIWSGFSSLLSLADNSIVAVGNIERTPSDLYIVKLDENGCFGPDDCGGGVVTSVAEVIADNPLSLLIYPNPIEKGQLLRIEINNSIQISGELHVQIVDVNGRQVINQRMLTQTVDVDVSILSSGVYFLKVIDQTGVTFTSRKLIVI